MGTQPLPISSFQLYVKNRASSAIYSHSGMLPYFGNKVTGPADHEIKFSKALCQKISFLFLSLLS